MAHRVARKKKMQELKQEREASDPCKCGRARSKKLPRPLAKALSESFHNGLDQLQRPTDIAVVTEVEESEPEYAPML